MSQAWDKVLLPTTWVYSPGASQAIVSSVPPPKRVLRPSPIIQLKAKKNLIEASGMRNASLRDSAAFVDFIAFLEEEVGITIGIFLVNRVNVLVKAGFRCQEEKT